MTKIKNILSITPIEYFPKEDGVVKMIQLARCCWLIRQPSMIVKATNEKSANGIVVPHLLLFLSNGSDSRSFIMNMTIQTMIIGKKPRMEFRNVGSYFRCDTASRQATFDS